MARKCFYSFYYKEDSQRAAKIRNIGVIEGNQSAKDNDWESIAGNNFAIEEWIAQQMAGRSRTIVLVGQNTANRKWINHEIVKSWNDCKGVVGIRIHGITNLAGYTSYIGQNPFDYITHAPTGRMLSEIVKLYDPAGLDSRSKYNWISNNIEAIVEEAISIRSSYGK